MKLARLELTDQNRRLELEASFDDRVSELIGEANDAGYSSAEAIEALLAVVKNQSFICGKDPDPADDPN